MLYVIQRNIFDFSGSCRLWHFVIDHIFLLQKLQELQVKNAVASHLGTLQDDDSFEKQQWTKTQKELQGMKARIEQQVGESKGIMQPFPVYCLSVILRQQLQEFPTNSAMTVLTHSSRNYNFDLLCNNRSSYHLKLISLVQSSLDSIVNLNSITVEEHYQNHSEQTVLNLFILMFLRQYFLISKLIQAAI